MSSPPWISVAEVSAERAPAPATTKSSADATLCYPGGRPSVTPLREVDPSPFCAPFDPAVLSNVERRISKDFVIDEKPSKLVIDFGCDEAYEDTARVWFESSTGTSDTFAFSRLTRDGDLYRVRRIRSATHAIQLAVESAELSASVVDELLASARVAMLAKPHVIKLRARESSTSMRAVPESHLYLAIVDQAGRVTERGFVGYGSSQDLDAMLPMELATAPLAKLLDATVFRPALIEDGDKTYFTERLKARLQHRPNWRVRERFLLLARKLGTSDALPALAVAAGTPVLDGAGGSDARAREAAIDAVAAISGWDPRVDPSGKARSSDEAAAVVAKECAPLNHPAPEN